MSFAPQANTDGSDNFTGNALRFATREEAQQWADDLMMRWTACQRVRVVESTDPVNYEIVDGVMRPVAAPATDGGEGEVTRTT